MFKSRLFCFGSWEGGRRRLKALGPVTYAWVKLLVPGIRLARPWATMTISEVNQKVGDLPPY